MVGAISHSLTDLCVMCYNTTFTVRAVLRVDVAVARIT